MAVRVGAYVGAYYDVATYLSYGEGAGKESERGHHRQRHRWGGHTAERNADVVAARVDALKSVWIRKKESRKNLSHLESSIKFKHTTHITFR